MPNACMPILVGVVFLVSEILLPSKTAKFPFLTMEYSPWPTMDYSPWSSKNSIDRNQLKKSCKYNLMSNACTPILVGMAILVSKIWLPSKTAKFPFPTMDYSPWSSKNSINRTQLKKSCKYNLMSNACTPILWAWPFWFQRYYYLQKRPNFPFSPWTIVHGGQIIELAQKFHASRG